MEQQHTLADLGVHVGRSPCPRWSDTRRPAVDRSATSWLLHLPGPKHAHLSPGAKRDAVSRLDDLGVPPVGLGSANPRLEQISES